MRPDRRRFITPILGASIGILLGVVCWWLLDYPMGWAIFVGSMGAFIGFALMLPGVSSRRVFGMTANWIISHNSFDSWGERAYEAIAGENEAGNAIAAPAKLVEYDCPGCGRKRTASASIIGEERICRHCGALTAVPHDARPAIPRSTSKYKLLFPVPDEIMATTENGEASFLVRYGDFLTELMTDDPWRNSRRSLLDLAIHVAGGQASGEAKTVGRENVTGLNEDEYVWYEYPLKPTRVNVTALLATRFRWTPEATQLAIPFDVSEADAEKVRQRMVELTKRSAETLERMHSDEHSDGR